MLCVLGAAKHDHLGVEARTCSLEIRLPSLEFGWMGSDD